MTQMTKRFCFIKKKNLSRKKFFTLMILNSKPNLESSLAFVCRRSSVLINCQRRKKFTETYANTEPTAIFNILSLRPSQPATGRVKFIEKNSPPRNNNKIN